jgi:hypothetical protein
MIRDKLYKFWSRHRKKELSVTHKKEKLIYKLNNIFSGMVHYSLYRIHTPYTYVHVHRQGFTIPFVCSSVTSIKINVDEWKILKFIC